MSTVRQRPDRQADCIVVGDGVTAAPLRLKDMIVVATHGRGAIGRWLHGSVSDDLALHAPVPVLLVHAEERVLAN